MGRGLGFCDSDTVGHTSTSDLDASVGHNSVGKFGDLVSYGYGAVENVLYGYLDLCHMHNPLVSLSALLSSIFKEEFEVFGPVILVVLITFLIIGLVPKIADRRIIEYVLTCILACSITICILTGFDLHHNDYVLFSVNSVYFGALLAAAYDLTS
jgi:hypothetical protein